MANSYKPADNQGSRNWRVGDQTVKRLIKIEQIPVSEEEMEQLYFDGRAIRRYCLQCKGPKFMMPSKRGSSQQGLADSKVPDRYQIVCGNCGMKYTAKLGE